MFKSILALALTVSGVCAIQLTPKFLSPTTLATVTTIVAQVEADPYFTFFDQDKDGEISAADIVAAYGVFQVTVDEKIAQELIHEVSCGNETLVNETFIYFIEGVYSTKVWIEYEFQARGAALPDGHVTKDDDINHELTIDPNWVEEKEFDDWWAAIDPEHKGLDFHTFCEIYSLSEEQICA